MPSFTRLLLPFAKTKSFDKFILDYLNKDSFLKGFFAFDDDLKGIEERIKSYKNPLLNREELGKILLSQYQSVGLEVSGKLLDNINLLKDENTFTITTGHQLNIFGGPLYIIYKLISVINLSDTLKKHFPNYNFIPVYWMATEDHDIEEISDINLFGKKYKWESAWKGTSGHMPLDGLDDLFNELKSVFGNSVHAVELISLVKSTYGSSKNLGEATRKWIHTLLAKYGLVILNGEDRVFKDKFKSIISDEVVNQTSSSLISNANEQIATRYHPQVNPREINLFYLGENFRERIIRKDETYAILNTDLNFTKEKLLDEINLHPERFSPNVVMRPVYQGSILPDIIFVGGPSELSYWLELKQLFEYHKIPMPVLMLRCSAMVIDKNSESKMQKLSFNTDDIFLSSDDLIKKYLDKTENEQPEFQLATATITGEFSKLSNAVSRVDITLKAVVEAESQKVTSSLNTLREKIVRSLKKKNETEINQIRKLKEKFFPGGKLQERHDSFLQYYLTWGQPFIDALKENFNPLDKQFIILVEKSE
jgi:bacillithiol biosynthesis cysteine-adding enzyme BshC